MYIKSPEGVSGVFQRCLGDVLWTFYRISMEIANNFSVVSTHRGFNVVSRIFHLSFKGFQGSFETFELSL